MIQLLYTRCLFAEALADFPGSRQLLRDGALGGSHVLTVRDGDDHAAAAGPCK